MNRIRRKALSEISSQLQGISSAAEEIRDAEQDAFDSMPENLQESQRGEAMEEGLEWLNQLVDSLGEAIEGADEGRA